MALVHGASCQGSCSDGTDRSRIGKDLFHTFIRLKFLTFSDTYGCQKATGFDVEALNRLGLDG